MIVIVHHVYTQIDMSTYSGHYVQRVMNKIMPWVVRPVIALVRMGTTGTTMTATAMLRCSDADMIV